MEVNIILPRMNEESHGNGGKYVHCKVKTVLLTNTMMHRNFDISTMISLSPVLPSQVLCRLRQRSGCGQADCPPGGL